MSDGISIRIIEDNDLCISCGACTYICPFDNILMQYKNERGKYDAVVQDDDVCLKCNGIKNCLAVCPSYNVDYETLASSSKNDFLGKVENVYNGYSKNDNSRHQASSGGFIRTMGKELLEKGVIDGVISITHDNGLDYSPKIINDVGMMPTSIYHNINYENAIELLMKNNGKYLLVALPCQITSIELLTEKKKYKHLKERIYAKVALICGYTFDRTNIEFFEFINHVAIDTVGYRENGRYRKTRISNKKESLLFDIANPRSINESINNSMMFDKWMPQKNCLYCVDHIGYCADIVVGDAWQKRYEEDKSGINIIVTRTSHGDNIVKNLESIFLEKGYLSEIEESQHQYAKPFLGLSVAKENFYKDRFVVSHILSKGTIVAPIVLFRFKDKVKMVFLKKLLRKKYFLVAKYLYMLLEFKLIFKQMVKRIIGRTI